MLIQQQLKITSHANMSIEKCASIKVGRLYSTI